MIITMNVDVKSLEESKEIKKILESKGVLVSRIPDLLLRERRLKRMEMLCSNYTGKIVKIGSLHSAGGCSYKTLQRDIATLVLEGKVEVLSKGPQKERQGNYTLVKFK